MTMTRREFIKKGGMSLLLLSLAGPLGLLDYDQIAHAAGSGNALVVIQLTGGNDGLNTVIPYTNSAYYDNRPNLAVPPGSVLALGGQLGLHPRLTGLKALYDQGKLAIINGVGYPNPSHAHSRAKEIWQTGTLDSTVTTGWLGRYLDLKPPALSTPVRGLTVGRASKIFLSQNHHVPVIDSMNEFQLMLKATINERVQQMQAIRQMYAVADGDSMLQLVRAKGTAALGTSDLLAAQLLNDMTDTGYPQSALAANLQLISRLVSTNLGISTYFTQLDGFDLHSGAQDEHARLLGELDSALCAFYADLTARNNADRVTVLIYSEFGRHIKEHAGGTDHGTAGPVLVLGGSVKGGLYGAMPSLTQLDSLGDLMHTVDFRSVYATLLDKWLQAPSSTILGGSYPTLPFL